MKTLLLFLLFIPISLYSQETIKNVDTTSIDTTSIKNEYKRLYDLPEITKDEYKVLLLLSNILKCIQNDCICPDYYKNVFFYYNVYKPCQ